MKSKDFCDFGSEVLRLSTWSCFFLVRCEEFKQYLVTLNLLFDDKENIIGFEQFIMALTLISNVSGAPIISSIQTFILHTKYCLSINIIEKSQLSNAEV